MSIAVALATHLALIQGEIVSGVKVAPWADLGVDDEPWPELCREIDRDGADRPISLVGLPMNPAAYFYLHHLRVPVEAISLAHLRRDPTALVVTRVELTDQLRGMGWRERGRAGSLLVMSLGLPVDETR